MNFPVELTYEKPTPEEIFKRNGIKCISNNYGELGEVGTVVFYPAKGYGMVIDDEGTIKWRDFRLTDKYQPRTLKHYKITFDRIVSPLFTKDTAVLKEYNYDIRQILTDNSIKDHNLNQAEIQATLEVKHGGGYKPIAESWI